MGKKTIYLALMIMLSLSSTMAFADKTDPNSSEKNAVPAKTENKLSDEELSRLTKRVEEIRDMDKSNLTAKEKRELRKELKEIKETMKEQGTYVYVTITALLILILILLLI